MIRRASLAVAALGTASLLTLPGTALAQDRDCPDFANRQEAQAAFEAQPGDPERLDADSDGMACESLGGGAEAAAPAEGSADAPSGVTTSGDEDSGTPPTGGVETGHGGTAESGSHVVPVGLAGAVLLTAGGALVRHRRASSAE
ncbi:calcium-binding protein [Saccharopolyspora rhizosphaerae]|uniref:Calcium-binding protein n=1 Tax=Saccharopolyspora rhizosphaerae TaxID=2492662 RepID=A0A3R8QTY3_9PSEU|nr:calcium-binding protein [Saccharopolyspora rhizosphaerae]